MSEVLAGWLLEQIAEDERVARASLGDAPHSGWERIGRHPDQARIDGADGIIIYDEGGHSREDADHIVLWQPDRALAECAAKRELLLLHQRRPRMSSSGRDECTCCSPTLGVPAWPCPTLLALAQPYAQRDGWRDEWSATP